MSKLLIIADDRHGFEELRDRLQADDVEVVSAGEAGIEIPDGDATTFGQNAMDIADRAARASGLVTLAESFGIEVDAFDGGPGVSSSRYAGTNATEAENRAELLNDVNEAAPASRAARLVSAIAVAGPDGRLQVFENALEGMIAREPRGVEGVGFEPIFELDDGMTIAELLPEQRERVHPRSVALAEARPVLDELLAGQGA